MLALCCPTFAGEMLCPPVAPPPPATAVQEPTTDGDMSAGATATTAHGDMQYGAASTFVEIVLNLLALALAR